MTADRSASHASNGSGQPSAVRRALRLGLRILVALVLLAVAVVASFYRADIPRDEMRLRWADDASRFVDVMGSQVHLKDQPARDRSQPDAPVLVLLHGTASSLHTWDGWVERLGDDLRIVRWDLQGFGLTGPNADQDYSIERQVEVGEAILDRLGIDSAVVAGNSLGGYIAWRWALARPERVERLILVDAAGYPISALATPRDGDGVPKRSALSLGTVPILKHVLTKITPRFLVENALEDVYGDATKVTEPLVQRHHDMLLSEGNRKALNDALAQRQATPPHERDLWREIPTIQQPTLILWGAQDDWIPLVMGSRFHQDLPNSELVVYEDAGHVPMEEIPEETARDVEEWLAATSPRPTPGSGSERPEANQRS